MSRIDIKNTTFRLEDGGSNILAVKVADGTVTYNEQKQREFLLDRGVIDTVRDGDEIPMDVQFQFAWEFLTAVASSGTPTIEDALKKRGEASGWTSSNPDACQPYSVDLKAVNIPDCATEEPEVYTFPMFYYESLGHDFKAGTVQSSGRCNATEPTVQRGDSYT